MKKAILGILITSVFSSAAFAQSYVNCEFKIKDNEVKCPLFRSCPQKELRESKTQVSIEVNDFGDTRGSIGLNELVLHPGTKNEDKNKVILFKDDQRFKSIRDEKDVDLVVFESGDDIDYVATKSGNTVHVTFTTPNYRYNMHMRGESVSIKDYLITTDSAISFSCETIGKNVFDEQERKRKAIEEHLQKKQEESKQAEAKSA